MCTNNVLVEQQERRKHDQYIARLHRVGVLYAIYLALFSYMKIYGVDAGSVEGWQVEVTP